MYLFVNLDDVDKITSISEMLKQKQRISSKMFPFGSERRLKTIAHNANLGPGCYEKFSIFGNNWIFSCLSFFEKNIIISFVVIIFKNTQINEFFLYLLT